MSHRALSVLLLAACSPPAVEPKGPIPSGAHFTLECESRGIRAYDETRSVISGVSLKCAAHVGDRLGAAAPNVPVSFLVEAGRLTAEGRTSASGRLEAVHEPALPLPLDVDPVVFNATPPLNDVINTGNFVAPMWMEPHHWNENPLLGALQFTLREPRRPDPIRLKPDGSGRYQNNPRDNLVTMIAIVEGEEAFTDENANGVYDPGELFVDLTEPFLDADDDGTRSAAEPFVDSNSNGQWDGKNGAWDAVAKIWVQHRVLWTGVPAWEDVQNVVPGVSGHRPTFLPPSTVALVCPFGPTCVQAGDPTNSFLPVRVFTFISDPWFNALTHIGPTDDCVAEGADLPVAVRLLGGPLVPQEVWPSVGQFMFEVSDARDPAGPAVPRRSPPASFETQLTCRFTGAPGGSVLHLGLGSLSGTIE